MCFADVDVFLAKFRHEVEQSTNRVCMSLQELRSGVQMYGLILRQSVHELQQLSQELLEMVQEHREIQQQQRQSLNLLEQISLLSLADSFKLTNAPDTPKIAPQCLLSAVSLGTEHPEALAADCT